jgi:hypothetical protein
MKKILLLYTIITAVMIIHQPEPVKQGITGKVYLRKGNYMPSPGHPLSKGKPLNCTIFIYEITSREEVTGNGVHYTNIRTKLVAKTQSNNDGYYAVSLPPGRYSVFADDAGQLYANSFDGKGNINPIEVKKDSMSTLDIIISSQAVY